MGIMSVRCLSNIVNLAVEVRSTEAACCCVITSKVGFGRRKGFGMKYSNKDLCLSLHSSASSYTSTRNNKIRGSGFDGFHSGDNGNGHSGSGRGRGSGDGSSNGNGGDGNEGGNNGNDSEEPKIPVVMNLEEVIKEAETRGVSLPLDMLEAARIDGIPKHILLRYFDLQGTVWPLGFAMSSRPCAWLRNRILADPTFLINLTTELAVYLCGITIGQVWKYGKDFWENFEVYASHLFVGLLAKSTLVCFTSPTVSIGQPKGFCGYLLRTYSGMFDKLMVNIGSPGSAGCALHSFWYMVTLYFLVGASCGLIGQGIIANGTRTFIRKMKKSNEDVPLQPLLGYGLRWGLEMVCYGSWELALFQLSCIPKAIEPEVGLVFHHAFGLANSISMGQCMARSNNEKAKLVHKRKYNERIGELD